jgi:branched-chain amino acid transport system ATP-binding protein
MTGALSEARASAQAALLDVSGLSAGYGGVAALSAVDLAVAAGEVVVLIGANGAGKSTCLKSLMGLLPATSGQIRLAGREISGLSTQARARAGLGYVPEGRRVFPGMTVQDNIEVACNAPAVERRRRRDYVFDIFPVLAERSNIRAWQLSGGQQQMLAIGRALMTGPRLLLMDEPSLGLAPVLAGEVLVLTRRLARDGMAVLLAEQAVLPALDVADRGLLLALGRVAASGTPEMLREHALVRYGLL